MISDGSCSRFLFFVSKIFSMKDLPDRRSLSIKIALLINLPTDDRCCMIKTDQQRNNQSGIPAPKRFILGIQSQNDTADFSQTR